MAAANASSKSDNDEYPPVNLLDIWFKPDNTMSVHGELFFLEQKTIGAFLSKMGAEEFVLPILKDRLCKEPEFVKKWDAQFKTQDLHQLPITRDYIEFCSANKIPTGFKVGFIAPSMQYNIGSALVFGHEQQPAATTTTTIDNNGNNSDDDDGVEVEAVDEEDDDGTETIDH